MNRSVFVVVACLSSCLGACKSETSDSPEASTDQGSGGEDSGMNGQGTGGLGGAGGADPMGTGASSMGGSGASPTGSGGGQSEDPPVITEVETVTATAQHAGGSDCLELSCPEGKLLLGGGGEWSEMIQLSSARPKDATTYELCGDAEAASSWTVVATCGVVSTNTMIVEYEEVVNLGNAPCIDAGCPDGYSVTGGGSTWHAAGTPDAQRSDAGSWGAHPTFNDFAMCGWSGGSNTWKAEAICVQDAVVEGHQVEVTLDTVDPGSPECVSVQCPAGQVMVSGGGRWTAQVQAHRVGVNEDGSRSTMCATHEYSSEIAADEEFWAMAACVPGD